MTTFCVIHVNHFSRKGQGRRRNNNLQTTKGFLNVAIWENICGHDMQLLKEFPLFPHGPSTRLRTSSLRLHFTPAFENFGLRIFGFNIKMLENLQ